MSKPPPISGKMQAFASGRLKIEGEAGKNWATTNGLTHNLGGMPYMNVCSITIVGRYGD